MKKQISIIAEAWKIELQDVQFRWRLALITIGFFLYSSVTQRLGSYIELRQGTRLEDKLLTFFPRVDFSTAIFFLLYASLFVCVVGYLNQPKLILRIIRMHFIVAIVRQLCILLIALEPPSGIIILHDVFLENTVYPPHAPLTKDLFFSGHVASIWIYFLYTRNMYLKIYLAAATGMMGFMVLCMRIHYTYDVCGAILITTAIYYADYIRLVAVAFKRRYVAAVNK